MTFRLVQGRAQLDMVAAILIAMASLSACDSKNAGVQQTSGDSLSSWAYPLHFGDSRGRAHEVLGNATRTTEVLEEYPMSGVTLWFSPEGRLTKLNFQGSAGALYSGPNSTAGQNWIPSDQSLVFGLTAHANEVDFARLLGTPVSENEAGSASTSELRRIWRKDGYLVDALFLASNRSDLGKTFPKGSLLWLEISPGL
jgi:hypothetical protein